LSSWNGCAAPDLGQNRQAAERYHELPYAIQLGGGTENRYIDLLYRDGDGWQDHRLSKPTRSSHPGTGKN
jgi:hypothetical protein